MQKTLIALAAAASLGTATLAPAPANAAWWVAPAIIAGVAGGVVVGSAIAANAYVDPRVPAAAYPRGTVTVQPRYAAAERCSITRERVAGGWRRIEVCR
jgi:hypothetical protein